MTLTIKDRKTTFSEPDIQKAVNERLEWWRAKLQNRLKWFRSASGRGYGSQARMSKTAVSAKGWPDNTVYLDKGRTFFIEVKYITGKLRKDQIAMHAYLENVLGHKVHVINAETPAHAKEQLDAIMEGYA